MSMPISHSEIIITAPALEEHLPEYPLEQANNTSTASPLQALTIQEKLDKDIESITAEIVSAGIKYTLATILPAFVLKLCSKVYGATILPDADHYAARISQQSNLLAGKYAQKYIVQLEGQNREFFNKTGEEIISRGGEFLAGYVSSQGWGEINKLADFYLDQLLGKVLMGWVAKPLAARVVNKLEKDFEKRWDVAPGKQKDYLANFAANSRDSLLKLIDQFDMNVFVQSKSGAVVDQKAQQGKLEFFNNLKGAARNFIQSDTFTQFLVGMIGKGLMSDRQDTLRQFIEVYMPNYAPQQDDRGNVILPKQIENFVGSMVGHLSTQAGIEAEQNMANFKEIDVVSEATDLAKKFFKDYLGQAQWSYLDGMVYSLVAERAKGDQQLVKTIWEGLKPDIEEYISTDVPSANNVVAQTFSLIKDILGGYVQQSGWEGIEGYLGLGGKNSQSMENTPTIQKRNQTPLSLLVQSANQRGWAQAKGVIEVFLGVNESQNGNTVEIENSNQSQAKLTVKLASLLGSILKKPGIEEAINRYTLGEPNQAVSPSISSRGSTMAIGSGLKVIVKGLQLMATNESQGWNYTAVSNWLAKEALVKGGEGVGAVLSTYLAGQGFTTLDEYVEKSLLGNVHQQLLAEQEGEQFLLAAAEYVNESSMEARAENSQALLQKQTDTLAALEVRQKLVSDVWRSIKYQLINEVFGSQTEFEKAYAVNKESAESVMLDEVLRKSVLGLPSQRELSTMGYTTTATTAAAKIGLKVAKAATTKLGSIAITAGQGTLNLTGRALVGTISATSVSLNYVAGSIWNWWGGTSEVEQRQDVAQES